MSLPHVVHASALPIGAVLGEVTDALASRTRVLLQAPPGAGKTTIVPLALLGAPWLGGRRIVMLEPRRLAARAAAGWMASLLGEDVGATVGVRVRAGSRVGPSTRIEVVTEGVLTRLLQEDPTLDRYGLVIFDEFHERSLQADAGLALTLYTQRLVRSDLRILVMSATLEVAGLDALLGDPPVVRAVGRQFPVDTRYVPPTREPATTAFVASATLRALGETDGDVLVFLPGVAEIRRCMSALREGGLPAGVSVVPLHGMLSSDEQHSAILAAPERGRRIVLATSIAETSLTIEGIRVVVDSGLARRPRFSPRTGMTRLHTSRASRAAAEQRRGRAGRVAPGVCYRLWDRSGEGALLPAAPPEILEADLVPLLLDLVVMGIVDPLELEWLDAPPSGALQYARELLRELEAVDDTGRITAHGRRLAALGTHPRLAHMITRSQEHGLADLACDIAALLEERDPLRSAPGTEVDLRSRLDLLRGDDEQLSRRGDSSSPDRDALRRIRTQASRWKKEIGSSPRPSSRDEAGSVLAWAYPDRVAQRRPGPAPRYVLRNGTGAVLPDGDPLHDSAFLVVAASDGRAPESRIFLAAPMAREDVLEQFSDAIASVDSAVEVLDNGRIVGTRSTRLGAIVLESHDRRRLDPADHGHALARFVERRGIHELPWTPQAVRLRQRLAVAHHLDAAWPDVSDGPLRTAFLEQCAIPGAIGTPRSLRDVDVVAFLRALIPPHRRGSLDRIAPARYRLPSGREVDIDYADPGRPSVEARIQEMFGVSESPVVGTSKLPLVVRLLSPANRPVQVTGDLAGFWRTSYREVRKSLRARYPKHDWPEDPLRAVPSARPRRSSRPDA